MTSPNPPTTENKTAETVNSIIRSANSAGEKLVESLIIAEVPWLGYPVVKTIFHWLLSWLVSYVSKAEQVGATFAVIDGQIDAEKNDLKKEIAAILAAQKTGDPDAIKKAIQAYADAHSNLVHNDGSATPK